MRTWQLFPFFAAFVFLLCCHLCASDPVDFFDTPADSSRSASSSDNTSSGSDSASRPKEKANKKYAVLVGVDDYEDPALGQLQYTVQDIEIIYDQLLEIGFEKENIFVLKSHSAAANRPTKRLINDRIDRVFDLAGPDDMVFLAFTGHGTQIDDTIYFCAEDTYISDKETTQNTSVSVSDVIKRFDRSPARFKWLVIDACRNNPFSRGAEIPGSRSIQNLDDPPRGSAVMLSCAPGEQSYEDKEFGHGLFTYSFVEGLKGSADLDNDGVLTLYELAKYTRNMTDVRADKLHFQQRPYLKGENSDFIIVDGLLRYGLKREVWSEADACFGRARQYRRDRRYEEAKSEIDRALSLTSKADPPTCSERQEYLDEKKDIELGLETEGSRLYSEAVALVSQGKYDEAQQKIEEALSLFPEKKEYLDYKERLTKLQLGKEHYVRARKAFEEGDNALASSSIEEALRIVPDNETYLLLKRLIDDRPKPGPAPLVPSAEPVSKLGIGTTPGEKKTITAKGIDYTFCWCPPGEFDLLP